MITYNFKRIFSVDLRVLRVSVVSFFKRLSNLYDGFKV